MRGRITKLIAGLTAIAALAVGGATFASAASKAPPVQLKPPVASVDGDTTQQGDQSTPDTGTAAEQSSEPSASEGAGEQPGDSNSESIANDGPGGHADEPANPNADHQFEGQE